MQEKSIYTEIYNLVDSYNLSRAFDLLKKEANAINDREALAELEKLWSTYRYMAEYMIRGQQDNTRPEVVADISESLLAINDKLKRDKIAVDSSDPYSETLRYLKLSNKKLTDLLTRYADLYSAYTLASAVKNDTKELTVEMGDLSKQIFNTVWTSINDKNMVEQVYTAIVSQKYGEMLPLLLVNALLLSSTYYFDRYKLQLLLRLYSEEISDAVSARALLGIVLFLNKFPERVKRIKDITLRLEDLKDNLLSYQRIKDTVLSIIRTKDTDRVSAKMKDEVIPEIMKISPEFIRRMREADPESLENGALENNPEWEEILENSGLTDKLKDLTEMQNEGADLMMVAFSNLKQFPFFNYPANWFLPFYLDHPEISSTEEDKAILSRLLEVGDSVCESDKYSLAFALSKMPQSQKQLMTTQLDAQFTQMKELMKEKDLHLSQPKFNEELTKSVRELYRFYKLFRKKNTLADPFIKPVNFLDLPVIGSLASEQEMVEIIAEFYFKRKYYSDALPLFLLLLDNNQDDTSLWEKIGFCYQSMKFYEKALESYIHAEFLKSPSSWLLKRIAYVNRRLGNYATAAEYYRRLLERDSENLSLLLNAAYCELESGNATEALEHYYHANYINPDDKNVLRALAWGEFLNKNFQKSEKYYERILSSSPSPSDFLNVGHLELVKGDMLKAATYYRKTAKEGYEDFRKTFLADLPVLTSLGVSSIDAHILLDALNMVE